jgi:hypothetical protein
MVHKPFKFEVKPKLMMFDVFCWLHPDSDKIVNIGIYNKKRAYKVSHFKVADNDN